MKKLLCSFAFLLCSTLPVKAADIYFGQSSAGSNNGTSCANQYAMTRFNTNDANWTAGNTLHLCGTITTGGVIQASGSAGNLITILFETGAQFSQATWPNGSIILGSSSARSYIRIRGGVTACSKANGVMVANVACNGLIEATNNGSAAGGYANQNDFSGIEFTNGCTECQIENVTVRNLYVHTASSDTTARNKLACITMSSGINSGSRINNSICNFAGSIGISTDGTIDNVEIDHNDVGNANWSYFSGSGASQITLITNFKFHDNDGHDWASWYIDGGGNHANCFHEIMENSNGNKELRAPQFYNIYCHGDVSPSQTALIFIDVQDPTIVTDPLSYNIILTQSDSDPLGNGAFAIEARNAKYYNITCIFPTTQTCINENNNGSVMPGTSTFKNMAMQKSNGAIVLQSSGGSDNTLVTATNNIYDTLSTNWQYNTQNFLNFTQWKSNCSCDASPSAQVASIDINATTYVPNMSSPLIGVGANLTSLGIAGLNSDIYGVARPGGATPWDVGAAQSGTVVPPVTRPRVNSSSLPNGIMGVPYSFTLSAVDGSPPYNWTPASFSNGLALSAAGVLAGTPNAAGNYVVPVQVNDTKGLSGVAALPLVISQFTPPLSTKYAIGDTFKVVTDGGRLNVRVCPNGAKVSTMNNGATAQTTGPAQVSSGATYWPMSRGCVPDINIRQ